MRPTTPRERKIVAIGLLVAAIAFVHLAIISPILGGFAERKERREQLLLEYQHNVRSIAAIPRLRRQAERQRDALSRFVLAAPTQPAATQALRERVERIVTEVGGEFLAADDVDAPAGWVGVRASARLTLDQLTHALARLQNEAPWLVVNGLDVAADQALINGQLNPMEVNLALAIPFRTAKPR